MTALLIAPKTVVKGALLALAGLLIPCLSLAEVLKADTVWQGEVRVAEDLLVPEGVTLVVKPGTRIKILKAESTKTDPEYLSPLTEITVRGTLRVEGTVAAPVEFSALEKKASSWAGIMVDQGTAILNGCRVSDAETGVQVLAGVVTLKGATLRENRYGLVASGESAQVTLNETRITDNDYGLFLFQGARVTSTVTTVTGNRKKDRFSGAARQNLPPAKFDGPAELPVSRVYQDGVLRGDTLWQGRIEVNGVIRVPEGSRLVVLPGTVVEFRRKATHGDGIGENGLMIQGLLVAKGTPEKPIIFRSAEKHKRMGDWDAINIMNSSGIQNLIEHCRIEDAYRALHFHYGNVVVHNSVLTNNYRAVQFQESQVEIRGCTISGNRSGVQGRDSDVTFLDNQVRDNYLGANFFRANLVALRNRFTGNRTEGFRIREGVLTLQENLVDGNRFGAMVSDTFYGDYSRNVFANNLETGISLKNVDNLEISGNLLTGNGLNGMNLQDARAVVRSNQFSDNGERGIGVISFDGVITQNNLAHNGLYAIDLEGSRPVDASANWWGGDEPARVVNDQRNNASAGEVHLERPNAEPFPIAWPLVQVQVDITWRGSIEVPKSVTVAAGAALSVAPKTRVSFAPGTGLLVRGKIIARGEPDGRIVFTSTQQKGPSDWDEIQLEYATGSDISFCVFEYATWGVHSHFTKLSVADSLFTRNYGGMRFRSGPVEIKGSLFKENTIGIRSYLGNAVISDNVITGNETGIFVREKGGGLVIRRNDLSDNLEYGIRAGDFNNEDINARENWWGGISPSQAIYDARQEPGIGRVLFEPYLKEPVVRPKGRVTP